MSLIICKNFETLTSNQPKEYISLFHKVTTFLSNRSKGKIIHPQKDSHAWPVALSLTLEREIAYLWLNRL